MQSEHNKPELIDHSEDQYQLDINQIHDAGISKEKFEANCNELFQQQVVQFNGRHRNQMDHQIEQLIEQVGSTIPILHIKDKLYLIGSERLTLDIINNVIFVNTPSGNKQ